MKPTIPDGWRKLRTGCKVRIGDRWWFQEQWVPIIKIFEMQDFVRIDEIVIRKKINETR